MNVFCPHCKNSIEVLQTEVREETVCPSCGSSFKLEAGASTTAWQSQNGKKLGKFDLLATLGHGAFGTVYKARDSQLDRIVAVKVPRASSLSGPQEQDRFVREARSTAQLRHASIVSLHEIGQVDNITYLVSDFIDGVNLSDYLTARQLSPRDAARLIAEVADALQYAHDQGVVHRDVKPSNIMLDQQNHPHLMDFGLARRDAGEITMTMDGQVLGTPAYMSPEQARGDAHIVDGRSDVYSLGVILYQLLTGELPFRGNTRMLLHQVLHDEPRSIRALNDHIPRDLETIALKALSKEPAKRYQTASSLRDDLHRFLKDEPIHARPTGQLEKLSRWCRRNAVVAGLLASIVVLLLAGIGVASWLAIRANAYAADADREKNNANAEADSAYRSMYFAHMNLAQVARNDGQLTEAKHWVDQYRVVTARKTDPRGWEWYYQDRLLQQEKATFDFKEPIGVNDLLFSPDGTKLIVTGAFHSSRIADKLFVTAINLSTGERQYTTPLSHYPKTVLSPDGMYLAIAKKHYESNIPTDSPAIAIWNAVTGTFIKHLPSSNQGTFDLAFSADGKMLAASGPDGGVRFWTIPEGRELKRLATDDQFGCLAFQPRGRFLVAVSKKNKTITLWNTETFEQSRVLQKDGIGFTEAQFSADGALIAALGSPANWNAQLHWFDVKSGQTRQVTGESVSRFQLSPDAKTMALSSIFGRKTEIWNLETNTLNHYLSEKHWQLQFCPDGRLLALASRDGVRLQPVESYSEYQHSTAHSTAVYNAAFRPDGRQFASVDYDGWLILYDRQTLQPFKRIQAHQRNCYRVNYSPDGKTLATGGNDGTVAIWDASSGELIRRLKSPQARVHSLAFNHDGRLLAAACGRYDAKNQELPGVVQIWDTTSGAEVQTLSGHQHMVYGVAFSPDGKCLYSGDREEVKAWSLATAQELWSSKCDLLLSMAVNRSGLIATGGYNTIKIWQPTDGKLITELRGHTSTIYGLDFSPDGRRLVSAGGGDDNFILWDVLTGQEVARLKTPTRGMAYSASFSSDGYSLITSCRNDVFLFDARPLTTDLQTERDAVELLDYLQPKLILRSDVESAIRNRQDISEPVRTKALALIDHYYKDADGLNDKAWNIVKKPNANLSEYQQALLYATAAVSLEPQNGNILNTLGVAQYRIKNYQEAIKTLLKSHEFNSKSPDSSQPADLAFLSMAYFQAGKKAEAQEWFRLLRKLMTDKRWVKNAEALEFLKEVESVLPTLQSPIAPQ